jgi:hypothetical protein
MILASDQCAGRPSRLLRFGGEWRQNEAECEPDPPHRHLGGGEFSRATKAVEIQGGRGSTVCSQRGFSAFWVVRCEA